MLEIGTLKGEIRLLEKMPDGKQSIIFYQGYPELLSLGYLVCLVQKFIIVKIEQDMIF